MLLDSFSQKESARQCGNGKVLESARFDICKSIMAKMIDVSNIIQLIAAQIKMEVGKLQSMMKSELSIKVGVNVGKINTDF